MAPDRTSQVRRRFLQGSLALAGLGLVSGCGMVAPPPSPRRPTQMSRIGMLTPPGVQPANTVAFRQGLRELGWVEGETLAVEYRFAGVHEALVARVAELIDLKVDVIVATSNEAIRVARSATGAIPIVMAVGDDPVGAGFVSSLAHPGGNVTGLTSLGSELGGKRLQLL